MNKPEQWGKPVLGLGFRLPVRSRGSDVCCLLSSLTPSVLIPDPPCCRTPRYLSSLDLIHLGHDRAWSSKNNNRPFAPWRDALRRVHGILKEGFTTENTEIYRSFVISVVNSVFIMRNIWTGNRMNSVDKDAKTKDMTR